MRYSASAGVSVSTALCVGVVIDLGEEPVRGLGRSWPLHHCKGSLFWGASSEWQENNREQVCVLYLCKSRWEGIARMHIYMQIALRGLTSLNPVMSSLSSQSLPPIITQTTTQLERMPRLFRRAYLSSMRTCESTWHRLHFSLEVPALPEICSPLSVVESNSRKKRLVINLRHLNRFYGKTSLGMRTCESTWEGWFYVFIWHQIWVSPFRHCTEALSIPRFFMAKPTFMYLQFFHSASPLHAVH